MMRYCILFITVIVLVGCGRQPYTTLYFAEDVTYEQAQQLIFAHTDKDERLGWVYFKDSASELEYSIQPKNLLNPLRHPPATVYAVRVEIKADRASVRAMAASPLIASVERWEIWKVIEYAINRLDKLWHRTH
jgi:hypothetical protein